MPRNQRDENLVIETGSATLGNHIRWNVGTVANSTNTVTISNVAPGGVGTATISKWLPIDVAGTIYYIPMWT